MKVVLTKDIRDVGRAHSVLEVADGHAINFLIPRKLAVPATPQALKLAESRMKQVVEKRSVESSLIKERVEALAEGKVTIVKKANEQGHLYDGVGADEIAEAANLPEDVIKLEKSIKEVGMHEVPVAIGDAFGKITVEVVAE